MSRRPREGPHPGLQSESGAGCHQEREDLPAAKAEGRAAEPGLGDRAEGQRSYITYIPLAKGFVYPLAVRQLHAIAERLPAVVDRFTRAAS